MPQHIAIHYDHPLGTFDTSIVSGLLERDEGLLTAVAVSLFTDARATPEDLEAAGIPNSDPRGHWGDTFRPRPIAGSKLWLLDRALRNDETLLRAETYASDALQWMIADGIASEVGTSASWWGQSFYLRLEVAIERPSNPEPRWVTAWNATTGQLIQEAA